MDSRLDMSQQQNLVAMKVNHIPGCISKIKGNGLRGAIVLYAQHSCRLIWNTESGFQVTSLLRQRRDVDKLERVQKAATTMVSWLEDTKSQERLSGAGLFHLQNRRVQGAGSGTI